MEEKTLVSANSVAPELFGGFILFSFLFGIITILIMNLFKSIIFDYMILYTMIGVIISGISLFLSWRCSIAIAFKKKIISKEDIKNLMIKMYVVSLLLCAYSIFTTVPDSLNTIKEAETYMTFANSVSLSDNSEYKAINEKFKKLINDSKVSIFISSAGSIVIYVGAVYLQKNALLKNAE